MRTFALVLVASFLAACGTSSAPQASSSPPAPVTAPPSPSAPPSDTPAATPTPPSGSGTAPAGSASAALLDIVRAARGHKVRMTIDTTHGGAARGSHMVVEVQPPDRRHSIMELPTGTHLETVLIGQDGWSRMGDAAPWRPTPQPSVAVGLASADGMIDQMAAQIASGAVQVSEDPAEAGFRRFHVVVPPGVMPTGGAWDGHIFVGSNGLPDHMDGTISGGPRGDGTVHETFAYDESIAIEPPL